MFQFAGLRHDGQDPAEVPHGAVQCAAPGPQRQLPDNAHRLEVHGGPSEVVGPLTTPGIIPILQVGERQHQAEPAGLPELQARHRRPDWPTVCPDVLLPQQAGP